MVTPTTASAAEATPELPGTLGMVHMGSATPPGGVTLLVGHRRGPGVPLIHGDHPVSPPVASADQPRRMLDKISAHRTVSGDLLDHLAIRDIRPAGDPLAVIAVVGMERMAVIADPDPTMTVVIMLVEDPGQPPTVRQIRTKRS